MALIPILGMDAADESLLGTANAQRRIGVALGMAMDPVNQKVFDRAIDNGWITFVDVAPGRGSNNSVINIRVFRLTDAGAARLQEIKGRKMVDGRH